MDANAANALFNALLLALAAWTIVTFFMVITAAVGKSEGQAQTTRVAITVEIIIIIFNLLAIVIKATVS